MKLTSYLFLGGPADGRRIPIENDASCWVVSEWDGELTGGDPSSPLTFTTMDTRIRQHFYYRRRLTVDSFPLHVYVHSRLTTAQALAGYYAPPPVNEGQPSPA